MRKFSFIKNEEGAVLVEAVMFILFILVPVFLGLVELSSYIRTKEKVNRVAHEMGELFSSMPKWSVAEAQNIKPAARFIATQRHGMNVSVAFCRGGGNNIPVDSFNWSFGEAKCGYRDLRDFPSVEFPVADCTNSGIPAGEGDGGAAGTAYPSAAQYVSVVASCHYSPMLRFFDFFTSELITANTVSPMREVVNFDN